MGNIKIIHFDSMGGILHQHDVFFRVWVPNASQVFVTGDFNN
jgi:1,4-alpha-glucan branching enzyme